MSQSIEQELNELRTLIAQSASKASPKVVKTLEDRLAALEARVVDPGSAARAAIVQALATADKGKPGFLSSPQLEERCKMTRSAVHTHVNSLEKEGKVWIRKTHGENGRPVFYIYHPAAVRA